IVLEMLGNPPKNVIDGAFSPSNNELHGAVGKVSDIPRHRKTPGDPARREPEAHPLHATLKEYPFRNDGRRIVFGHCHRIPDAFDLVDVSLSVIPVHPIGGVLTLGSAI